MGNFIIEKETRTQNRENDLKYITVGTESHTNCMMLPAVTLPDMRKGSTSLKAKVQGLLDIMCDHIVSKGNDAEKTNVKAE